MTTKKTLTGLGISILVVLFAIFVGGEMNQQSTSNESDGIQDIELQPEQKEIEPLPQELEISEKTFPEEQSCSGEARCITGFVTRIVDGDTISVDGQSVRFALVDTPEYGEYDYTQAKNYIETVCPVGSKVLVDEDDGQTQGSHGRIIGVIYCNDLNLSEEILEVGHAEILPSICPKSEFADEDWAQKFGC